MGEASVRTEAKADDTKTNLVGRLMSRLVLFVARFPITTLIFAALTAAASVYLACTKLAYHTQRDDLLNPDKECQRRWKRYVAEFGTDEDMVVVVQGKPAQHVRMTEAVERVAERLRRQPELFDRIFFKADLRALQARALLFLPVEQIRQIQADLERMKPLLEAPVAWQLFSLRSLLVEAELRLNGIAGGKAVTESDRRFFDQLRGVARSAKAFLSQPEHYENPWTPLGASAADGQPPSLSIEMLARPQYLFSDDGTLAMLLVRPACAADGFCGHRESVEGLREIVRDVKTSFNDVEIGVTGLPVLETDEMTASQNDTNLASWLALAGVALLYLIVFRGLRYPLLTVTTLAVGTVWALGWVTITVGHLNLLSATFAVMLIGMGDYGVLWITRYDQERAAGKDLREALEITAKTVGPGIVTAGVTTGLAFFATILADFLAVAELGWIAGSGVLLCALACFVVLPALIAITDRRRKIAERGLRIADWIAAKPEAEGAWLPGLMRRPRAVVLAGAALTLGFGFFVFRVSYDHNLLNLQSEDLESVRWEKTLLTHTAGASWHALCYRDTPEEAQALKRRLEQLPQVSRVVDVAMLVPPDQEGKLGQLQDIQRRLAKLPPAGQRINHVTSDPNNLLQGLAKLVAHPGLATHADLRADLVGLRDQLKQSPAQQAGNRLHDFEHRMVVDLASGLNALRDVAHPVPIALEDVPVALRERYVSENGKWLLRVFGKESLWEYEPLARFTTAVAAIDPEATGKPFTTLEGLRAMKEGFQRAGMYALLAIFVVLCLDFRKPLPVLLALGPLAVGILMSLGLMGLCGVALNPANMIALPLIVGVGVDNGVHVLHDFLSRRRDRAYLLSRTTGKGILVAALTTILGFGTLMISSHRGLVSLGLLLSLGVTCCMLAALVFLPALLHLWSRTEQGDSRPVSMPFEIPSFRRAA